MFKSRAFNSIIGFVIVVLVLFNIGTAIDAQPISSSTAGSRLSALDRYFAHDRAIPDGDNTVVSTEKSHTVNQLTPLDWYLAHSHAVLDGDNNVLSDETSPVNRQLAPLDWYFAHPHAILDGGW